MPSTAKPKAKVKAKAKAGVRLSPKAKARRISMRDRQKKRRQAVKLMNELAAELHLDAFALKGAARKGPSPKATDKLAKRLDARCHTTALKDRLKAALQMWTQNGGSLSSAVIEDSTDPSGQQSPSAVPNHGILKPNFILQSSAFMMTFNSASFATEAWTDFVAWIKEKQRQLGARGYAACLEFSLKSSGMPNGSRRVHLHGYLYWNDGVGLYRRNLDDLTFQNVRPRIDKCLVKSGVTPRASAFHGLWYVTVMKLGTHASATNFEPWVQYKPQGAWLVGLWESKKVSDEQFLKLSAEFRSGHANRKRDLCAVLSEDREAAAAALVAAEGKALAGQRRDMRSFPDVDAFVELFKHPAFRRPLLAIIGGTNLGKSELGAAILRRVGELLGIPDFLEVTVEGDAAMDLSDLDCRTHAGVLLDGVGDALFLKHNREVLQGRAKLCKGGRSATMMYSYTYTLCHRAVVATFDLSAKNLHLLSSDHWLSNPLNVVQIHLDAPAWQHDPSLLPHVNASVSQRGNVRRMTSDALYSFLVTQDLAGPAEVLRANAVNGADFLTLTETDYQRELRMTPFASKKLARFCRSLG